MNGDLSELIKYLDEKFGKIDGEFREVDERFSKIDGEFRKIDERFGRLFDVFATKEDLERAIENISTKEDFNRLITSVDAYAKKADTYFQEMVMLSSQG